MTNRSCRPAGRAWGRHAFTLIELLVVIAVISLLAALVMPVLEQAFRQADLATCRSNLRQMGSALSMYCTNWRGLYPPAGAPNSANRYSISRMGGGKVGLGCLCPDYLPDGRIFYCPSMTAWLVYENEEWCFPNFPHDYCDVGYIYAVHAGNGECLRRPQPTEQAMVSDNLIALSLIPGPRWGCGHYLHVTGYNVLYADGHVEWYADLDESIAATPPYSGSSRMLEIWDAFTKRKPL